MAVEQSANLIDWETLETALHEEDGQQFQTLPIDIGAPAVFYRARLELLDPAE